MTNIQIVMKIKELKELLANASDNDRLELVDGEITLVKEKPIEYKFKVGDRVICPRFADASEIMTITERLSVNGCPCYNLTPDKNIKIQCLEEDIHPYVPEDITERIKTFDDACKWCVENGKREMLHTYSLIFNGLMNPPFEITEEVDDLLAYLKLRIITAALNEGWEPTFELGEGRYVAEFNSIEGLIDYDYEGEWVRTSRRMIFKSSALANYAIAQFHDIYADFCGCGKGGEE